jgi:carbon monoxide dehydrogenase subunit G
MALHVEGSYTFKAPRDQVYRLLLDPESLKTCIPGCESMALVGPDTYEATVKVGIAAVKGTYKGQVRISDKVEPEQYRMAIEGKGGPGFGKGSALITLVEAEGTTIVKVAGGGQVGGLIAGVAQRLVGGVSKMMMDQFFGCMAKKVEVGAHAADAAQPS